MNPASSITEYLSQDRDRLDGILLKVRGLVGRGELAAAAAAYPEFQRGLARHIRIEEELLFPAFEKLSGMVHGPTMVMRQEHRAIEQALGAMQRALAAEDAAGFRDGALLLEDVLPSHNLKEERILYPGSDELMTAAERGAFVERCKTWAEEPTSSTM